MATTEAKHTQMEGLATLLILDDEIRRLANVREFGFFATNESHRLIRYHTAYLWDKRDIIGVHLVAQSGAAEVDAHAPTNTWLLEKIRLICKGAKAKEIHQESNQSEEDGKPALPWAEALPHYLLWCPFLDRNREVVGGLIYFRETAFTEIEIKMIGWLIASFQYAWLTLNKHKRPPLHFYLKKKPYLAGASIITLCILFYPIRLSVLASGTVVPQNPILINAPMEGVIKSFAVSPGQTVRAGQLLLSLDKTDLQSTYEVSEKELQLTQAKLRTAISEGLNNKASRAEAPILAAQANIDKAHIQYTNERLNNADITSPTDGIVVFDSKEDWVGQPVRTGERILAIANPKQVELKITLPVSDVIKLEVGGSGEFFLYGQLSGVKIRLTTIGYNAKLMPNKILAYQLSAVFVDDSVIPMLGAQGTTVLYGNRVPVIYYLLRRPLQAIRQSLGI